jgi:hypothetical protein
MIKILTNDYKDVLEIESNDSVFKLIDRLKPLKEWSFISNVWYL